MNFINELIERRSSENGFAFIIIILIVIIAFSIMLVTGSEGFKLSTNQQSSSSNNSPQPTATQSGTISPTPSSNESSWGINFSLNGCTDENSETYMSGTLSATGDSTGYIELAVDSNDNTNIIQTRPFISPGSTYELKLRNSNGFNQDSWTINIYEGGSQSNNSWSGGTLQSSVNGNPTNC